MAADLSKSRLLSEAGVTDAYNQLQMRPSLATRGGRIAEWTDDPPRAPLRVLVVDAYRAAADTMSRQVKLWGHDVRSAYDGTTGLQVAAEYHPNVVLLDVGMSGVSGSELGRELRHQVRSTDCLIIAVTGRIDERRRRHCEEAGIDLVLIKPVEPSVVETLLMLESEYVWSRQDSVPFRVLSKALWLTSQPQESTKFPCRVPLGTPALSGGCEAC